MYGYGSTHVTRRHLASRALSPATAGIAFLGHESVESALSADQWKPNAVGSRP